MSSDPSFVASALGGASLTFNWVFLVELLVCGVVTLFFLFYFNRLFATLVSYGLRAWTWHKYRVYIDIQAIQISVLGGRIFFKGVKYHGNNETILIHEGFITWCYWIRKVRELDLDDPKELRRKETPKATKDDGSSMYEDYEDIEAEKTCEKTPKKLPCRLNVEIKGLEWFIYNRGAAYDSILAAMTGEDEIEPESTPEKNEANDESRLDGLKRRFRHKMNGTHSATNEITKTKSEPLSEKPSTSSSNEKSDELNHLTTRSTTSPRIDISDPNELQDNLLLQFLPIHVECSKAAIVMGNENTKSVLIVKLDTAAGEIDASSCRDPDLYRQLINFDLVHPVVQMKPNDDYKEDQTSAAIRIKGGTKKVPKPKYKNGRNLGSIVCVEKLSTGSKISCRHFVVR